MDYHKIYNIQNVNPFYMLYEKQTAELRMRDIQKKLYQNNSYDKTLKK